MKGSEVVTQSGLVLMSAAAPRRMNLGVFAVGNGNHVAGWCHPGAAKSGDDIRSYIDIGQRTEGPPRRT